jgi:hypothetical protein
VPPFRFVIALTPAGLARSFYLSMANPKHHLIISGTGRAGTTFLVQLFTQLGLDTGFSDPNAKISEHTNAGMEWDLRRRPNAPYIIKSPALCDRLEELLASGDYVVDHALIPVRDLFSAAESRRDVARKGDFKFLTPLRRGWRRLRNPDQQEMALTGHLYQLIYTLARHDIPTTLLFFPRLANDPEYLFRKVQFMMPGVEYSKFEVAFKAVSRPDLIHNYQASPAAAAPE